MNNGNAAARRALFAGAIGNVVEWYDFALYGYFATTIAHLFFPEEDAVAALLATFVVFAVGFVSRPVGAVVFGHVGDRYSRRTSLIMSVGLMSAATVVLGLLPGYAQIGVAAPVLLLVCRLVQGFSAGGEFTGSTVFVLEHAPDNRRGRYASVGAAAIYCGTASGVLVSVLMTSTTSVEQLGSWGWRVPFLLAAPLAVVGLYLRLRVEDSPVFEALQEHGQVESAPLVETFRVAKKPMLVLIGWVMATSVSYYLSATFLVSYLTTTAKFSHTASLVVQLVFSVASGACTLLAGHVIDRVGRRRFVAVTSILGMGVWAVPAFAVLERGSLLGACLVVGVAAVIYSFVGVITTLAIVELFPAYVRASASGLAYGTAYTVFGGTAPFVATWLVGQGHPLGPGFYLAGVCAVATLAAAIGFGTRPRIDPVHDVVQAAAVGPKGARA